MKNLIRTLTFLLLFCSTSTEAQTYSLETKQESYQYLTNATEIVKKDTAWFIGASRKFSLGISWKGIQNAKYDSFFIDTKGYLDFNNNVDTFSTAVVMFFMPGTNAYFSDKGSWPQPSKSPISLLITGNSGSRIAKIEFRNIGIRGGNPKDSLNFQVWFYEQTGDVEYHYGPSYIADATYVNDTYTGPLIGISTGSKKYQLMDANIVYGDPSNPKLWTGYKNPTSETITGFPANGTVYRLKRGASGINSLRLNNHTQVTARGNNTWQVASNEAAKFSYQLVNVLGEKVAEGQGVSSAEINLQPFADGIYILNIESKEALMVTKLIKQ